MTAALVLMRRLGLAGLLALDLGFANALRLAIVHPVRVEPASLVPWDPRLAGLAQPAWQPAPAESFSQSLARPIFSRARRPYQPPQPALPGPPPAPVPAIVPPRQAEEGIVLLGIMLNGDTRRALLRLKAFPGGKWVTLGEEVNGWQLSEVAQDRAMLQADGQRLLLRLYREPGGQ